jgi:hypothetical protein
MGDCLYGSFGFFIGICLHYCERVLIMFISNQIIDNAIELILNTRDFCGDEKQAIKDYCHDEKIADWKKVYSIANFRANARWNQFKKDAVVNPKYTF